MSFPDPITPAPRATSEASLNLPAARALAEEAKQWHDSAYPEKAPVEKLIATLFALCDEVERERAEHAAQLAALREVCAAECERLEDQPHTQFGPLPHYAFPYECADGIRALPLPSPTAALARVRAEAVREIAVAMGLDGVFWDADSALLYAEERAAVAVESADEMRSLLEDALSYVRTESSGCSCEPTVGDAGRCLECRLVVALTPPAGEEAR